MDTPRLETDRLILREIQQSDTLSIFHCWMKDENVSRYMWWKASADITDTERFVSEEIGKTDSDSWYRWIIVEKESNRIIGTSLFYFSEEGNWDISYNLGTEFWGKGYTTEAMREVIKYAAKDLGDKERKRK